MLTAHCRNLARHPLPDSKTSTLHTWDIVNSPTPAAEGIFLPRDGWILLGECCFVQTEGFCGNPLVPANSLVLFCLAAGQLLTAQGQHHRATRYGTCDKHRAGAWLGKSLTTLLVAGVRDLPAPVTRGCCSSACLELWLCSPEWVGEAARVDDCCTASFVGRRLKKGKKKKSTKMNPLCLFIQWESLDFISPWGLLNTVKLLLTTG